jgi:hypothetical protein
MNRKNDHQATVYEPSGQIVQGARVDQNGNLVLVFSRGKAGFPTVCASQVLEK